MPLNILLCAEDILSATLARDLCDRVVFERAEADWLRALWAPELRDTQRVWSGLDQDTWWSDRPTCGREADLASVPNTIRVRETGRRKAFHGVAGLAFRTALLAESLAIRPDVLVLAGDTDGEEDPARLRRAGVDGAAVSLPVLIAEPVREAEAWVVAGFVPRNDAEQGRFNDVKKTLGFDPTASPERLLSDVSGDRRDTKMICRWLLGTDALSPATERVRSCWLDSPLDLLIERGERCGLSSYVRQIESVLLPLLGDTPKPRPSRREALSLSRAELEVSPVENCLSRVIDQSFFNVMVRSF
ncbi:MAG: hypothetical protein U0165_13970 [Polyangiaceae bacterium]